MVPGVAAVAAVVPVVGGEEHLVLPGPVHRDGIALVAAVGGEVEHEEQAAPLKGDDVVVLVDPAQGGPALVEDAVILRRGDHVVVEVVQVLVFQVRVAHQAPLAAAVLEAVAVAGAGEVDPLRVAELVAHEVQVAVAAGGQGQQADHLVQGDGPVDDLGVGVLLHLVVHGRVGEAEDHGLVPHQGLVVALHIGDGGRVAEGELRPQVAQVPVLVPPLLGVFDPQIRDAHAQAVVEADAAVGHGLAHAGHAGHVLGDGQRARVHLPDQVVGQLQVGDGLHVRVHGEIHPQVGEGGAQAVVPVEHGGDAVEAEAVEVELLHPELQVAQQEVEHLRLVVVEALGAPGAVVSPAALVEELVGRAVEEVDALQGVAHRVGVHHVQQHPQAHAVGLVHQVLQVVRVAVAAGAGEEVAHLVAEGAVEGVLHDGHELHRVVAHALNVGEDVVGELPVGGDAVVLAGHAHVGLIDEGRLVQGEILVRPGEGVPVLHHLAAPALGGPVLDGPAGVEGEVLGETVAVFHDGHHPAAGADGVPGQFHLPVAVLQAGEGGVQPVPVVEVPGEVQRVRPGGPLPVDPARLRPVEAVPAVGVGKVVQAGGMLQQLGLLGPVELHAQLQVGGKRHQLRMSLQHADHGSSSSFRYQLYGVSAGPIVTDPAGLVHPFSRPGGAGGGRGITGPARR